jgi:hypothetical protein
VLFVTVLACVHAPATSGPRPAYLFEPRLQDGEIRVVPVLRLYPSTELETHTWLGLPLGAQALAAREDRTRGLELLSLAVGRALPGEVNAALGATWSGQFRTGTLGAMGRMRLAEALRTPGADVDDVLSSVAANVGGDAVLFTWIDALDSSPVTLLGAEGSVIATDAGPVVADHGDEPYVVSARVTAALVAHDGEVLLRYGDVFHTVLSEAHPPEEAGRDLAGDLAGELALVWATDPRLR